MATLTYNVLDTAPVILAKKAGRFYAPELDALRFLAFMMVFGRHVLSGLGFVMKSVNGQQPTSSAAVATLPHHAGWLSMLKPQDFAQAFDFGVCLFFFLSAFLITRLLLIEKEATGGVAVGRFYLRRSLRIWPLYFFFLALALVASHYSDTLHVSGQRVLAAAFFVGNWAAVAHGWSSMAIQPLWSVSVEEQFYGVWPLFARSGRKAIVMISCLLVIVSLLVLMYYGNKPGSQITATWPNTFVQGLFLAGGALTACFSFPESRWLPNKTRLAFIVAGSCCWLVASAGLHIVRTQSPGALALVTGYLLVLAGTYCIFTGVAGWSAWPVPAWILYLGKISYGLYVFHVACLLIAEHAVPGFLSAWHIRPSSVYLVEMISAALALMLTIVCASLTHRFLERPFLQLKDRFSSVHSRPV